MFTAHLSSLSICISGSFGLLFRFLYRAYFRSVLICISVKSLPIMDFTASINSALVEYFFLSRLFNCSRISPGIPFSCSFSKEDLSNLKPSLLISSSMASASFRSFSEEILPSFFLFALISGLPCSPFSLLISSLSA